jgi:ryanodine receptor 2
MPTDPYRPAPIKTTGISLPPELEAHLERLAEHVHDLWSVRRMEEGWTMGATRSDQAHTHPNLVPYAELGEGDKDYDRMVARETLRAVIALGYRILPPGEATGW